MPTVSRYISLFAGFLALGSGIGAAQAQDVQPAADAAPAAVPQSVVLNVPQMFELAEQARQRGDYATAEQLLRALAGNPDIEVRTEARFRLGMMLADDMHQPAVAAIEFRKILDEKPRATRVRLELARMDMQLGRPGDAARELRAAEATGLPPDVRQAVRFYAAALDDQKPFGYSFKAAIAPDTNINRATRSDTFGTVIGDFVLDQDAKAQSGVGMAARGQAFARFGIDKRARLLVQANAQGSFYRRSQFNDFILGLEAGPEVSSGTDRFYVNGYATWRWFGGDPYNRTLGVGLSWRHPAGNKAQLRLSGAIGQDDNLRNNLQDATNYTASVQYDRAFSAVGGGGLTISAARSAAQDPGYSLTSGVAGAYLYRELGPVTVVANAGYSHLEADKRLLLYPLRRVDDRYFIGIGANFRFLRLGSVSPFVQLNYERNDSTVELYKYSRVSGEFGITAAF